MGGLGKLAAGGPVRHKQVIHPSLACASGGRIVKVVMYNIIWSECVRYKKHLQFYLTFRG
ncbi:hypothetical protein C0U40_15100 [Amylibacter cionae]|nr:hypothetical protein C0U40_15100 [Amylibacter cionae]